MFRLSKTLRILICIVVLSCRVAGQNREDAAEGEEEPIDQALIEEITKGMSYTDSTKIKSGV